MLNHHLPNNLQVLVDHFNNDTVCFELILRSHIKYWSVSSSCCEALSVYLHKGHDLYHALSSHHLPALWCILSNKAEMPWKQKCRKNPLNALLRVQHIARETKWMHCVCFPSIFFLTPSKASTECDITSSPVGKATLKHKVNGAEG